MTEMERGTLRDKIELLEQSMLENVAAQVQLEPTHTFCKGLYARSLFIPAGTLLTGKIHKTEHLNIVAQGVITVWTETGMKRIQAPAVLPSYPGAKRAGFAHTDTTWITVHPTELTDVAELEELLVCATQAEFELFLAGGASCHSLR